MASYLAHDHHAQPVTSGRIDAEPMIGDESQLAHQPPSTARTIAILYTRAPVWHTAPHSHTGPLKKSRHCAWSAHSVGGTKERGAGGVVFAGL